MRNAVVVVGENRINVFEDGSVFNQRGKKLSHHKRGKDGYPYIEVTPAFKEKRKRIFVRRLLAENFIPNPKGLKEVNHKNLDKQDNRVTNLEWVTGKQNREHYRRMKLQRVV